MDDAQLVRIIEDREARADTSRIDKEYYSEALNYYMGQPNGHELPDRSSIVMMEEFAIIEWIKPVLTKIFFGGPSVLKFTPKSAEDEEQAKQETDYVNHVILDQNDGFTCMLNWFTDAMLSRNSYVFAYYDKRIDTTESEYADITIEQLAMLLEGDENELLEASARQVATAGGMEELYTVRVKTREAKGKVCIDNIPPERVRVDANHRSVNLKDCPFVEYYERKTISELREAGFDIDDDINDDDQDEGYAQSVEDARLGRTQSNFLDDDDADPASREITVRTVFLRVDYDGDGIAELRRVVLVGSTVLYNEPDDIITVAALTPTIVPHRHVGMSMHDVIKQLQDLKTQLARGLIDNVHLANNGRWFLTDNVDIDDFLNGRPNAPVRVEGETVSGQALPFNHPLLGQQIIGTLEYADSVLENWTGASPRSLQGQTFDGNSINRTASGLSQIMSAAVARIELIARIFAETGMKDLFRIVHALTLQHGRKAQTVKLRGKWVEVDPATWEKRDSLTVETGLGSGDRQERIGALQALITAQTTMLQQGMNLSSPPKIYNSLAKLTEEMGYKDPSQFWDDPSQQPQGAGLESLPGPQREAIVRQVAELAKAEAEKMTAQIRNEGQQRGIDADLQRAAIERDAAQQAKFVDAQVSLAKSMLEADNALLSKGIELDQGADDPVALREQLEAERTKPRTKRVVHKRDAAGNIVESQLIED